MPSAQETDIPDFESLYREHFEYVWASLRRLGVRPPNLEDVTQDVFLTVHRRLHTYDPARPLRPWIFGIAMRVASDFRKLARHRREVGPIPGEAASNDARPDHQAGDLEARRIVAEALRAIGESRRPVFILHDIDELVMREVAEVLSIPLHTGYSRLRKAREEFASAVRRIQGVGEGA